MRNKIVLAGILGVALAIAAVAASSPAALAARGGGGGKGGGKPAPAATCTLSAPSQVAYGSTFVVSGSGFAPYQQVTVYRDGAGYGMFADANGKVALSLWSGGVGKHSLSASKLVNSTWAPCWSATYEVVP